MNVYRSNTLALVAYEPYVPPPGLSGPVVSHASSINDINLYIKNVINEKYVILSFEDIDNIYKSNLHMYIDCSRDGRNMKICGYQVVVETETKCILI
jgi:hypothetical protein